MTLTEQIQQDIVAAMKAGEKQRVSALRMVVSELQKNAKEGDGDEVAVLQRERKRRLESATAFRDGGRAESAASEEAEAAMIATYLPEQISDEELTQLVTEAIAQTGAESPKDIGKVMGAVMPKVKGRADGSRISAAAKEQLLS